MRAAALLLLLAPLPAPAQEREMSTDRPDKTESPYSVPQGRVQIELDFATWTRDRSDDVRVEEVAVTPINVKFGLARDTDVQVIVAPYIRRTATDLASGARIRNDGFGDVTVRLKQNLWGNDGGASAFALMPFVTLPTGSGGVGTDLIEFGLIAPLGIELSQGIGLGLMTEVDVVADDDGRGRQVSFINSATVGFELTDRLGAYTELFTERAEDWIVTGDVGVTYALSDETQLDAGVNLGISDAADDVTLFVGFSRRF